MSLSERADPVVLVSVTVMDGTIIRWHRSVDDAEIHRPVLSASRHGVEVHASFLTDLPRAWVSAAIEAYETLRRTPKADMGHLATHCHSVVPNGPLVPISEASGE